MPPINWQALSSIARARPGSSHPIKDSALSNPAVDKIVRGEQVNSLSGARLGESAELAGSALANPAYRQVIGGEQVNSLGEARIRSSAALEGSPLADPTYRAMAGDVGNEEKKPGPGCMFVAKNALNGGELSPFMAGRFDQPKFLTGCKKLHNMVTLPTGGIAMRPGFTFLAASRGAEDPESSAACFIPFVFSANETRLLELTSLNDTGSIVNVWDNFCTLIAPSAVEMPYNRNEIKEISYIQSGDVVYLAHPNHPPAKLMRYGDRDWRYEVISWMPKIEAPRISATWYGYSENGWNSHQSYHYVATAVDKDTGEESAASAALELSAVPQLGVSNSTLVIHVDGAVENAAEYRVYKKEGGVYGFVGRIEADASELILEDKNITPDTEDGPPEPRNPFEDGGNPSVVFLHQQRLCWASSDKKPVTIWMSQSGNYESMAASTPPKDDDAIEVTMAAPQANRIVWCKSDRSALAIGTQGAEWLLTGADGDTLTPGNLCFQPQTSYGSEAGLPPLEAGSNLIYIQNGGHNVREFSYSMQSDRYESPDLTIMARHLFSLRRIKGWAWQGNPYSIVWCVMEDGTLAALTYIRGQEVCSWHTHSIEGGYIEDICALPFTDGYHRIYLHVVHGGRRYLAMSLLWIETLTDGIQHTAYLEGPNNDIPVRGSCIPYLPETTLQNGSTWMRVNKLNAIKAHVLNAHSFKARIGDGPWMNVPERLPKTTFTRGPAFWNLPIAGGWRENADLELSFADGPATVLGILATMELADLAGSQG